MKKTILVLSLLAVLPAISIYSQSTYIDPNDDCNCDYYAPEGGGWVKVMSKSDFNDFKKLVEDRWFESTKSELAKGVIERNYFTTGQVKEMLKLFSFESTKVELAKYAYTRTVDNRKYYKIYDVFWFDSSISEIEDYIKDQY